MNALNYSHTTSKKIFLNAPIVHGQGVNAQIRSYEVEEISDPQNSKVYVRPAYGAENELPCLKASHSVLARRIMVDGQTVFIEALISEGSETIYLVNGNEISVPDHFDKVTGQITIDLRKAKYLEGWVSDYDSGYAELRHAGRWLHLSERDEMALALYLRDIDESQIILLFSRDEIFMQEDC